MLNDLISRAKAGDATALGSLLEHTRSYLTVLGRAQIGRRLRAKADLDDLVQETHLQAYREFPRFEGDHDAAFLAWLRAIFASRLHKLLRHYATEARDLSREQDLSAAFDESSRLLGGLVPASPDPSPSAQVSNEEELLRVTEEVMQLPDDAREALLLHHLEGLPWEEVGQRLGRTADAARKVWARALDLLRRRLGAKP